MFLGYVEKSFYKKFLEEEAHKLSRPGENYIVEACRSRYET